ncbi:Protein CBG13296 [Caenorhabditis briggsae]|uniref:Uncharacterized protein n=3 Tax=Caenorhabditis briggsae TaxID=6238 RepID=A0AAE9DB60_CAEBR|nr:Protein CBG13296 [Caenorhabditis briggsae]ULU00407.1 hypothetical protein L3Y34_001118 [Caenorhabditis briggsae]UMM23078.1 hypothetical protein L5515_003972 [Caenorhabditis briggsae]CAP32105.1 Protein CBG13296 [Caenorhabditis briggsae]
MAKVEVQIRRCFCCGLSVATSVIAVYTFILYLLLAIAAGVALSDTATNGDSSHYNSCELEAQGKINAENRKLTFTGGRTVVVVEDSTSYHCSLGLYTEELKYSAANRYTSLVIDIILYVSICLASVILLIGLCSYNQWLLIPWGFLMIIDIVRGFISVFFIFWYSYGNLARIATGIFFLGLQFLHITLLMTIIAKFQRISNRKNGIPDKVYDVRGGSRAPSTYYGETHAVAPPVHRGENYYPDQHRQQPYGHYDQQPPYRY